jgi:hypothetical protein
VIRSLALAQGDNCKWPRTARSVLVGALVPESSEPVSADVRSAPPLCKQVSCPIETRLSTRAFRNGVLSRTLRVVARYDTHGASR